MAYRSTGLKENAHNDGVWSLCFLTQDKFISGGVDASIKLWQSQVESNQTNINLLNGNNFNLHRLAIISLDVDKTSQGKIFASSSLDSTVRLWDVEKTKSIQHFDASPMESWSISFSPDGKTIATGSQNGNINLISVASNKVEQSFDAQRKSFAMNVNYSPSGRFIASGLQDGTINIYDIATSKLLHQLTGSLGHSMTVRKVVFTNDSSQLLSCSDDKHIHLYDVNSGNLIKSFHAHQSFALNLAVSPLNNTFASGSTDRQVKIWEMNTLDCIYTSTADHKDQVWSLAYNNTGNLLATGSDDQSIRLIQCPLDNSK